MTITILFFLVVGLMTFHFVYEGIIAPTLRLRLRFRLFRLRDELRRLWLEASPRIPEEEFRRYQQTLNASISFLSYVNVVNLYEARQAVKKDRELYEKMKQRAAILGSCQSQEVLRIYNESQRILIEALCVNCGGWGIYILPILGVSMILDRVKAFLTGLTTLPEEDIKRIAPNMRSAKSFRRPASSLS
jgi:hypothetical protein